MSASPPLYNLDAARGEAQAERMRELEGEGVCVFCPEHAAAQVAELGGEHWYVMRNDFPYEGTTAHYLIVARRHVVSFEELPDEAGGELWAIRRALAQRLGAVAYATVERSGDMRFNGGSVAHLHEHFVALEREPVATVRFRVSARAEQGGDED
jgi:diadenosine tetraphosphate (Ap4A) HIT family hydrolase